MATHVLIVEDDKKIAKVVAKNLEAIGMQCHVVSDGRVALETFKRVKPDLTVLDIIMPSLDVVSN